MENDFLKEVNKKVIEYLSNNGLIFETAEAKDDFIKFYNYSMPQYEEEKESILIELENFYKVFDMLVFVDVEQLGDFGEVLTITIKNDIPLF